MKIRSASPDDFPQIVKLIKTKDELFLVYTNTKALLLYTQLGFKPYKAEERVSPTNEKTVLIHMKLSP